MTDLFIVVPNFSCVISEVTLKENNTHTHAQNFRVSLKKKGSKKIAESHSNDFRKELEPHRT